MRVSEIITLGAVLALSACSAANDAADALARDQAKSVVNSVVAEQFPAVNPAPVTDCIIDAASASEILSIASASVTGVTTQTVDQVLQIAQRPDAITCYTSNSIALIGL